MILNPAQKAKEEAEKEAERRESEGIVTTLYKMCILF